ncbi:AraC family transcriptional regulator [Sporocytophaga myxococcoides]|uniref:AraC family transcriptional regulator n=1 Tax=Sporocytophaga myxococcoides TaxID=153721 RepID=UPI0004108E21|nr:AraC family transcriptional regulator [Sporocytophaga myxococcoides]
MKVFSIHDFLKSLQTIGATVYSFNQHYSKLQIKRKDVCGDIYGYQIDNGVVMAIHDLEISQPLCFPSLSQEEYFKISFFIEGDFRMTNSVSGKSQEIQGGTCRGFFFRSKGINRVYPKKKKIVSVDLGIRLGLLKEVLKNLPSSKINLKMIQLIDSFQNISILGRIPPNINKILTEILQNKESDFAQLLVIRAKVFELLAELMKLSDSFIWENNQSNFLSEKDLQKLFKAREYLEDNISNPPTLKELSKIVCLNEFKLKKGFKECFQSTVHNYLVDRRLCASCTLLKKSDCPISQIAYDIGYQCPSKFIHSFRKRFGVTPGQFRKQNGQLV